MLQPRDGKFPTTADKEDSSLAQLLRDTDPSIAGNSPGRNIQLDHSPGVPRSQYQQSKFLDGGGNFVDPNKVLPGHFAGKGMLTKCLSCITYCQNIKLTFYDRCKLIPLATLA